MTRNYLFGLLVLLALSLADWCISRAMITAGLAREANPLAAQVIARFGWGGFLAGKLIHWALVACWGLAPWKLLPDSTLLRWTPLAFTLPAQAVVTAACVRLFFVL
jgi:hypothetical protein